jgi:hypothetical protein
MLALPYRFHEIYDLPAREQLFRDLVEHRLEPHQIRAFLDTVAEALDNLTDEATAAHVRVIALRDAVWDAADDMADSAEVENLLSLAESALKEPTQ